jgi:dihydrofolate synthase/folylpolyglutamate synthase
MFALRRFGIKLGLATMRRMLAGLGRPERRYRCIHVAGTNGKGSVASALAAVLQLAGYRVGLYTSPHLVRFNERIRVDGREISDADIVRLYRRVARVSAGGREPTFFEFTTAMAFDEFARQRVEWAVIETGMGGRLDATNVITPELSVITNISREHREYLGDTIARIAFEKAGIIKRARPVVTAVRQPSALAALRRRADELAAPLYRLGDQFLTRRGPGGTFAYRGIAQVWRGLSTGLQGAHQVDNAALVLAACELLMAAAPKLKPDHIRAGLRENRWPGRLEQVSERPLVIFDGAHNLDAARQLARYVSAHFEERPLTLVVGILDDKPYRAMLKLLAPLAARVIATQARINRALPAPLIADTARPLAPEVVVIADVARALRHAVETSPADGLTLVAGSLYVVGEAKAAVERGFVRFKRLT